MPINRIRHRLVWAVIRNPKAKKVKVELLLTDGPDMVADARWMSDFGWEVALVGMHKAAVGMLVSFVDSKTLRELPANPPLTRVMTSKNTYYNAGVVSNGDAVMAKAAEGWQKAFKNQGETLPIAHHLAVQFGQALVKENGKIKLCLAWVNTNLFARHYAQTLLGRRIKHTLEKAKCDALVAAAGALNVDVASLLHSNVALQCIPVELKSKGSNHVEKHGPRTAKVYVSKGSQVWLNNKGVKAAAEEKKAVWVIADAFPTTSGGIYYKVAVVGWRTLVDLVETGKLYNAGREIPKVQPNPDFVRYGRRKWNKAKKAHDLFPHFVSTEPILQCAATNVVYKRDTIGRYNPAPDTNTTVLYFDDIEECCRNDDVKGAILVEGGAADSVIEAIRTVKDVDNIETITIKDANLDTHVESWVRSVLLVEGMLNGILISKNSFTEFKWHLEYKCDGEAIGLTVATLSLREANRLTFQFNSQLQHASVELGKKEKRQPVPYYVSACLVACRAFTEAELARLGIVLPAARIARLGGFPIKVAYVLPTDLGSYCGGIEVLQSGVSVDLDDFEDRLLNKPLSHKRDRSSIQQLLNECFCFESDFQRLVLARGRTYIRWSDATCGKVPGVQELWEPDSAMKYRTTFVNNKPTVSDPGDADSLDCDDGWGRARVRDPVEVQDSAQSAQSTCIIT